MSDNNGNDSLLAFILGASMGVMAGLLLAPRPGKETRRRLQKWMEDVEDISEDFVEEGRDLWKQGKRIALDSADRIKNSVETTKRKVRDRP